jgi:hypothetical protein
MASEAFLKPIDWSKMPPKSRKRLTPYQGSKDITPWLSTLLGYSLRSILLS